MNETNDEKPRAKKAEELKKSNENKLWSVDDGRGWF